ncbi:related to RRD1 - Resistant to Rapamycin Deletion (protein phosphatase 2A regulator activity) [Ustilago trichophora]|uniref:Serine/threonine-protein phosphatase 2A activator n=1 Tax=Ustilago trichophora TaxID=86804 RepID=A0A5C3EIG9_9BASI|nr:related to RRD1 - Resistant to Rapamycin Deletion (protein phosphatase 2A regulator activity) [Ustilago trichophora]
MPMITPAMRQAASSSSSMAATSSNTAVLDTQPLPSLPRIPISPATLSRISNPVKKIASQEDVQKWKQSPAYSTYLLFLQRVCEASVGKATRLPPPPSSSLTDDATPMDKLIKLLYDLNRWTDEIEPQSKPQRFGNLAFRDWGARLSDRIDQLHATLLPDHLHPFIPELKAYLVDAFGSFTRIDYGSGHELSFFAWICYLYRLGFLFTQRDEGRKEESVDDVKVEEKLGLEIFPLYLLIVWRLQDRYGLEPAGSHGVWGLDDYHFLPYVIGAAQWRRQSALRPGQVVAASAHPTILTDQLGGANRTPHALISTALTLPSSLLVHPSQSVDEQEGTALTPNLYLTSLLRIQVLKRGPFHEHSPLLHDIATTVPNWVKVYTGMVKMYCAECLGKKVVVQHFPFGGVGYDWSDEPVVASTTATSNGGRGGGMGMALGGERGNMGSMGVPTARVTGVMPATGMPATGMPGMGMVGTTFLRTTAPGENGVRLGSALGLGPRVGQASRQGTTFPTTRAGAATSGSGSMVPPLRMPAPAPTPVTRNTSKPDQEEK